MEMYLIKDAVANRTVAVIDGKQMSLEEAFEAMRHEIQSVNNKKDNAVKLLEKFIRFSNSCCFCAKKRCILRDKNRTAKSPCRPVWNEEYDLS